MPAGTSNTNTTLIGITPPNGNTGTLSVVGSQVISGNLSGWGGIGVQITGTASGGVAVFEGSADGSNFFTYPLATPTAGNQVTSITTTGFWQGSVTGLQTFRVRLTAIVAGSWVVTLKPAVDSTPALTAVTVNNTNTGSNAAAGLVGVSPPSSADYQGVKVGSNLQGVTGLNVGSQIAQVVAVVDGSGTQVTTFGGAGGTSSNINSATPAQATYAGFSDGTNMQGARVFDTDSGGGVENTLGVNLRQIGSGGSVEAGVSAHPLRIDPTGTTPQPASQSGTWNIGTVTTVSTATVVGNVADAGTDSGDPVLVAGTYTTATPTYTNGQRGRARIDANGNLLVNVNAGGASNPAAGSTGAAVPASADYQGINIGGNLTGVTGFSLGTARAQAIAIVDGSGNQVTTFGGSGGTSSNVGSAVPSAATAAGFSDGTNLQLARVFDADTGGGTQYVEGVILRSSASGGSNEAGTSSFPLRVDPTGTTTQPVSLASVPTHAVTQSGAWNVGQTGTWTVQPGNSANTTPWLVKEQASSAVPTLGLNVAVTTIVNSPAVLTDYYIYNPNSSVAYVQLFDSASVVVGTTPPKWSLGVPAGAAANLSGMNLQFNTSIKVAATQTASGGAGVVTAIDANWGYR